MIWSVPEIIATLSTLVTLQAAGHHWHDRPPAGVGTTARGQTCLCEIEGLSDASVTFEA
jgi:fumarylpyruvate hydrolase